jgi:acetoacetyl-CoA synthetase
MPFSELLYCSNPEVLTQQLEKFKLAVLARERSVSVFSLPTFVSPHPKAALRIPKVRYYRSAQVSSTEIDLLYSELAVLPQ